MPGARLTSPHRLPTCQEGGSHCIPGPGQGDPRSSRRASCAATRQLVEESVKLSWDAQSCAHGRCNRAAGITSGGLQPVTLAPAYHLTVRFQSKAPVHFRCHAWITAAVPPQTEPRRRHTLPTTCVTSTGSSRLDQYCIAAGALWMGTVRESREGERERVLRKRCIHHFQPHRQDITRQIPA